MPTLGKPKFEYAEIELEAIPEVHPSISDLRKKLSIPPFEPPRQDSFRHEGLIFLLKSCPISVTYVGKSKSYHCIGNITLYWLARKLLSPKAKIPVFVSRIRLSKTEIQQRYLSEFFLLPAVHHIGTKNVPIYHEKWQQLNASVCNELNLINPLQCSKIQTFFHTYKSSNCSRKKTPQ